MPSRSVLSGVAAEALKQASGRLLPLAPPVHCAAEIVVQLRQLPASTLFPEARNAAAALSGLLLLLGCWDESHAMSQEIDSPDGFYWHAIAHRMEPDGANAAYWFRRAGRHPVFEAVHSAAADILKSTSAISWRLKSAWDPYLFIAWCEEARQEPGGERERMAVAMQQAEYLLLLEWCAGPNA